MRPLFALAIVAWPALAAAQPLSGPYVGFAAGGEIRPGDLLRAPRGDVPVSAARGAGSGATTLGSAGYGWRNGLRVEVEGLQGSSRARTAGPASP